MRASFVVIALAASALALSGCANPDGTKPSVEQVIAQVQNITANACKFLPTAATIAEIISAGTFTGAASIAAAICAAIKPQPTTTPGTQLAVPRVGRVIVRGQYLK